jgi:hypothetical protein
MSALDDAENLIRDKTQTLDPEAVYSQVLLMSVVSVRRCPDVTNSFAHITFSLGRYNRRF